MAADSLSQLRRNAVVMAMAVTCLLQVSAFHHISIPAPTGSRRSVGTPPRSYSSATTRQHGRSTQLFNGYQPPIEQKIVPKTRKPLLPKIGDVVRCYDLDGGKADGEVIVGKISFISSSSKKQWIADITELEDVGDGYFAEYSSRKRLSKKVERSLRDISPISASFVRSENAYKVPFNGVQPAVRQEQYDLDDYEGPILSMESVDQSVVARDAETYSTLKGNLFKYSFLTGLAGTVVTEFVKGTEDAIIYAAGVAASLGYLYFLSVKTDTIASPERKLGSRVANLRFLMPLLVLTGIAGFNAVQGRSISTSSDNPFQLVTSEQYAAAIIGFLTYRIPLFLNQLQEFLKEDASSDDEMNVPVGSLGVAMRLASQDGDDAQSALTTQPNIKPLLLVSGPKATKRSELVQRLIQQQASEDVVYTAPATIDRMQDEATYERLEKRNEIIVSDERFAISKESILKSILDTTSDKNTITVLDADVDTAKLIADQLPRNYVIGVWVGLKSLKEYEQNLPPRSDDDEDSEENSVRGQLKQVVNDIEYGISSGQFDFTILSDDMEVASKELREAAAYCLKE